MWWTGVRFRSVGRFTFALFLGWMSFARIEFPIQRTHLIKFRTSNATPQYYHVSQIEFRYAFIGISQLP